jgi:hypothetical protein
MLTDLGSPLKKGAKLGRAVNRVKHLKIAVVISF